jgi:hypothetical protein
MSDFAAVFRFSQWEVDLDRYSGATMENAISGAGVARSQQQSAVQNQSRPESWIKLALVWLAVGLPLVWGAMKALQDIGSLPL